MGYAIAEAALARGHEVILISGPVALAAPVAAHTIHVISAAEMYAAVEGQISKKVDAGIFCAAVADYRPLTIADQKIKKSGESRMELVLEKTADILGCARDEMAFTGTLVGFAAETNNLEKHARHKLTTKKCDLIIANHVGTSETGFDVDENELHLFYPDGHSKKLPCQTKALLGEKVIEIIEKLGDAGA